MPNQELSEEWQKLIIGKSEKWKVYSYFKNNIWGADVADMQSTNKFNKGFRFLLCYWYLYYIWKGCSFER